MRWTHGLLILALLTTGCASNIKDTDLLASNTIMLPPTIANTVFLQNRNSSDNQAVTLSDLPTRLSSKGYQIVKDPQQAAYWLQTQVLYCHKAGSGVKPDSVAKGGFGSGIGSGGTALPGGGAMSGGMMPGLPGGTGMMSMGGMPMGGGMPDINAMMAQAMRAQGSYGMQPPPEEDIIYMCVADVLVTDRARGSASAPSASDRHARKTYRMRSVGHVLQKDLNILEATPIVQEKLSTGITGPF